MKRLTGYIILAFVLFGGFCAVVTTLSISRSIDTVANLAAEEIRRPPSSSEVIAESLDRRLHTEEPPGFLSFFGGLSLAALAVGGLFGYYWLKAKFLRQKRLTHRAINQPNTARRIPRITIPAPRQLSEGEEVNDHDRRY